MGSTESVLSNRGLEIMAKKCLYKGVIVPTALYGAEAGMADEKCCEKESECSCDEVFEKFGWSVTNG